MINKLEICGLTKHFGEKKLFEDLNLTLAEPAVLWAPSGWGKTTLLRILMGLEAPDSGTVQGVGRVGAVFQEDRLCPQLTAVQNVELVLPEGKTQYKTQIVSDFQRFGYDKQALALPARKLSGGQKQRVGIARALTTDPELLLCDEATSALDPQTTESILKLLKRINREMGVTILLITHQMQVVQMICNKVAVMESGKIVESGSVLEVFGSPKMPVTKRFVQTVIRDQIPDSIVSLVKEQKENFRVDRLKFIGSSVKRPVISDICKTEGIVVNILGAAVQELEDSVMCVFILQLIGDDKSIEKAEAEIDKNGVLRERLEVE